MAISRRTGRSRFTLVILVLTSVTLITLDFRGDGGGVFDRVRSGALEVLGPMGDVAAAVVSPVGDVFGALVNYSDLEAENDRLRDQLAEARGAALRAADTERELEELGDLLDLDFAADIPSVAARVVSTGMTNFEVTVEIDRGSDHGVAEGMPVVSGQGLVGRVTQVAPSRSVVLLLSDSTFNVGVRFTGSGDVGVAKGGGQGEDLSVDLVEADTDAVKGELVVTSGLQQSVFPPGIPVGTVLSSELPPGGLQREVSLDPVADLRRLAFVKVLQWTGNR